jgi:hypothetical protein
VSTGGVAFSALREGADLVQLRRAPTAVVDGGQGEASQGARQRRLPRRRPHQRQSRRRKRLRGPTPGNAICCCSAGGCVNPGLAPAADCGSGRTRSGPCAPRRPRRAAGGERAGSSSSRNASTGSRRAVAFRRRCGDGPRSFVMSCVSSPLRAPVARQSACCSGRFEPDPAVTRPSRICTRSSRRNDGAKPHSALQLTAGVGFEPTDGLHRQRFSRPPRSTAPAPRLGSLCRRSAWSRGFAAAELGRLSEARRGQKEGAHGGTTGSPVLAPAPRLGPLCRRSGGRRGLPPLDARFLGAHA